MGGGITRTFRPWTHTSEDSYIYQRSLVVVTATDVSFERSEFLIPTWVTPQYRATSKKKICACVRLILVLVGGRQTAIVVARYDGMIPGTYGVCTRYICTWYQPAENLYVRTLCFCFCFPFLFQHGTPTFLVTKVLEKENPPEILYTKREIPQGVS